MKFLLPLLALTISAHAETESPLRLIRTTDALTPVEEQKGLHVPEGFEVQLFASEPMINKPINMAFDERGRLWVSSTVEYPYSAAKERWSDPQGSHIKDSRDAIKILEDTDGDGKADKVTVFADGLNIPTGVLPWHKPEDKAGCIAWSIPNIWYFADTDGDGVCDKREVLFGPLGYEKDTHGMCSSFRLGLDGWVYATHGFNNTSHLKAKDGSTLDLHSGNVFRFRPDGSHVEIWAWGQVNPFGLCWDRYNNLYSADCHSNPLTQLIRGAYYPSFGKPHDGLGYGPVMCDHSHGSTGLCGVLYIDGGVWGPEWDDHMILGNCVTSKVNHDHITFTGSTPKAVEGPDFITSDDPWFRPVDLQLGPDSALYVADFYNKIIGHYEVPLDHPGRDKERGRIWRVSRNGHSKRSPSFDIDDLGHAVHLCSSPNTNIRRLAHQEMMVRNGPKPMLLIEGRDAMESRLAYHWWYLSFLKAHNKPLEYNSWDAVSRTSPENLVTLLQEWTEYGPGERLPQAAVAQGLKHDSPQVRRWSAQALQAWPSKDTQAALIAALKAAEADHDAGLHHTLQRALLENLKLPGAFASLGEENQAAVRDIARVVPSAEAARFLFERWSGGTLPGDTGLPGIVARHADDATLHALMEHSRASFKAPDIVPVLTGIHNGLLERGMKPPAVFVEWASAAVEGLLKETSKADIQWQSVPHPDFPDSESPWCLQERKCADGQQVKVLSSLNKDLKSPEKLTGILRSKPFAAPEKLSFWLCGHMGAPKSEANQKNLVRLVDAEGHEISTVYPPRSDVCQKVEWDLAAAKGKPVRLELVDGDNGPSYAWLGVTRIEPAVVTVESFVSDDARQKDLKTLANILRLHASPALRDKLRPFLPPSKAAPLAVSPEDRKRLDALIAGRLKAFAQAKPDAAKGQQVFTTNCAVCHQIKSQGGIVGPQLDGIGNRGADRLMEDVLDPNRNVDANFQMHIVTLLDDSTLSGFLRGEVGQVVILVDAAGQEHRVGKNEIKKDETTAMSLMPPVFGQTIPEADFFNLMSFLLTKS